MMSVCLYYLAKNPDCQANLHDEIDAVIGDNNGSRHLDYSVVQELPYLDKVVQETLRLYPLMFLERKCMKDYKIPDSDFTIPKGMLVQICHHAIMRDPKYYPSGDTFDPENFSPENKAARSPYAYLPFGQGPRNCIGMRFALLQMKVAISRVMADYKVLPSPKTVKELIGDPQSSSVLPKGGIYLSLESRQK